MDFLIVLLLVTGEWVFIDPKMPLTEHECKEEVRRIILSAEGKVQAGACTINQRKRT